MSKVALAMIVKGTEGEHLDRCLSTVAKWVDGIYLTITQDGDDAIEVGKKYGAVIDDKHRYDFNKAPTKKDLKWYKDTFDIDTHVTPKDKIFMFDEARNHSFSIVPEEYEWLLWLDADDILRGGHKMKDLVKIADQKNIDSIFFNYLYKVEADDEGKIKNIIIQHLRERLVRRGVYEWVAPIHETLIAQRQDKKTETKDCDVVHLTNDPRMQGALTRNIKTLEMSICQSKGKDPRPVYYLGKAYFDIGILENNQDAMITADKLFNAYLHGTEEHEFKNRSGWADERAQCWNYRAEVFRSLQKYNKALKCHANALLEQEQAFPANYLSMALTYTVMQKHDKAMHWLNLGLRTPQPETTLVTNPKELESRAHEISYHYAAAKNNSQLMLEASKALADLDPHNPEMGQRYAQAMAIQNNIELSKAFTYLADYLMTNGQADKLKTLLASAPKEIANNPFVIELEKRLSPPRDWEENEIAIFCGPGWTVWSPAKLKDPKGSFMGGSEEAVVHVSQELKKLGWKVTVFAEPGEDEGDHDGVTYLPYYKFNAKDYFNILIGWRNPAFADGGYETKKLYIWCHDIQNPLDYTPERLEKIDKIFLLSPWHRENVPDVPEDKIIISANGITL